MIDLLYFAALFITLIGILFGLRFAFLRHNINDLQKRVDTFTDETYKKFVAIIFIIRKKDRDPIQALNFAAQYFSWKDIQNQLAKFYRNNKYFEIIDIVGLVFSVLIVITKYLYDFFPDGRVFIIKVIIFLVALILTIVSFLTFLKSYHKLNKMEKRLGIGQPQSNH